MNDKNEGLTQFAHIYSDHWLGRDANLHFDFEGLAKTLSELAWNPANETPFTVVVRGGWGRGKTTLLRRTQALLEDKDKPKDARDAKTLWFNAWKYPDEDSVLAGLLGVLLAEFERGGFIKQLKGFLEKNKSTAILQLLRAAAPWLQQDAKLGSLFDTKPISANEYGLLEEKRAFHDTFRKLFSRLTHLLLFSRDLLRDTGNVSEEELWKRRDENQDSQKRTLAIFLDDLDRCPDKRILETLEAINLFLDLPGVCFYLGLDWEQLAHKLHKHFGERTDEFLEKIVQISLTLPEVNAQDTAKYITELVASHPVLQQCLGDEDVPIVAGLLESRHPRHVKRFLNDLSIRLAVLNNTDRLGPKSPQLPPPAIVAWHLLHEALPEFAQRTAKLSANLNAFLREWSETRAKIKAGNADENVEEPLRKAHEQGQLDPFIARLEALSPDQREALVHFGSPPEDEVEAAHSKTRSIGFSKHDWVEIKAGSFQVGSKHRQDSQPVHLVKMTNNFFVAKTPVTHEQYKRYIDMTAVAPPKSWDGGKIPQGKQDHPVVYVSWEDAMAYCEWLNAQQQLEQGWQIRLPTEAEWEYVAAGTGDQKREHPWGYEAPDESLANFGNKVGDTTPVTAFPKGATPEGVLDMAGNVWEWCLDYYDEDFYKKSQAENPCNLTKSTSCVLRGGAFNYSPDSLRAAYRFRNLPYLRNFNVGFRVVLSPFSISDL